jgi:hypothetical protein
VGGVLVLATCNLVDREPAVREMTARVDAGVVNGPISPLVYGVSNSSGAEPYFEEMGVTLVRWGGNARTRHNWEINASNTGADWEYANVPQGDGAPGAASVAFHERNAAAGVESLLTLPMIGWVAKDRESRAPIVEALLKPGLAAPPLAFWSSRRVEALADPLQTSIPSLPRKPGLFHYPPDLGDGAVYQDEWLHYLTERLGTASDGGVRFLEMDNEPMQWTQTHPDVRSEPLGYREYFDRYVAYAEAAKAVDPSVAVLAPSAWGWTDYFYSARDQGLEESLPGTPDRREHGGMAFIPWFLREAQAHDARRGARTLDMLAVHYYPQGEVFSEATDPETNALRLRSTRSLWDPSYREESWIARTAEGPVVRLIPRMKEWIDRHYPGTGLALTEWSWGAPQHITGGLAVADVLGILGREGVNVATYWGAPPAGSPAYWAFRVYRNYDGEGNGFGDVSIKAESAYPDWVSLYASRDSNTGDVVVVLINKSADRAVRVGVELVGFRPGPEARLYRFAEGEEQILRLSPAPVDGGILAQDLPPYSITLAVISSE